MWASSIITHVCCIVPVTSLTAPCRSVLFVLEPPLHGFQRAQLAHVQVSAVGLCSDQRQLSNVLVMITPFGIALPDWRALMMAPFSSFHSGELRLDHLLCHHCLLQGCPELMRHRFLPDGLFVLVQLLSICWRAMRESVDTRNNLLVCLNSFTRLPRSVPRTSVSGTLPLWTSLHPHE